jgi:hypothetical protein
MVEARPFGIECVKHFPVLGDSNQAFGSLLGTAPASSVSPFPARLNERAKVTDKQKVRRPNREARHELHHGEEIG